LLFLLVYTCSRVHFYQQDFRTSAAVFLNFFEIKKTVFVSLLSSSRQRTFEMENGAAFVPAI
jgi:hypothetical protein